MTPEEEQNLRDEYERIGKILYEIDHAEQRDKNAALVGKCFSKPFATGMEYCSVTHVEAAMPTAFSFRTGKYGVEIEFYTMADQDRRWVEIDNNVFDTAWKECVSMLMTTDPHAVKTADDLDKESR